MQKNSERQLETGASILLEEKNQNIVGTVILNNERNLKREWINTSTHLFRVGLAKYKEKMTTHQIIQVFVFTRMKYIHSICRDCNASLVYNAKRNANCIQKFYQCNLKTMYAFYIAIL